MEGTLGSSGPWEAVGPSVHTRWLCLWPHFGSSVAFCGAKELLDSADCEKGCYRVFMEFRFSMELTEHTVPRGEDKHLKFGTLPDSHASF